jgi:hypothetical protein
VTLAQNGGKVVSLCKLHPPTPLKVRYGVLHPWKTTGKIMILHILILMLLDTKWKKLMDQMVGGIAQI